jgi:hypothetical protein
MQALAQDARRAMVRLAEVPPDLEAQRDARPRATRLHPWSFVAGLAAAAVILATAVLLR